MPPTEPPTEPKEPTAADGDTMRLYGVGPRCPGCGGPTHAVTGDESAENPWWCKNCNARLNGDGEAASRASFPAGADPDDTEDER